jgi:hypothetical protein
MISYKNRKRPQAETSGLLNEGLGTQIIHQEKINGKELLALVKKANPLVTKRKELLHIKNLYERYLNYFGYSINELFPKTDKRAEIKGGTLQCL